MLKMGTRHGCPPMFSFHRFSFDLIEWVMSDVLEARMERRRLIKQEAANLIERSGPGAFDVAQNVAQLARQRDDVEAKKLGWMSRERSPDRMRSFVADSANGFSATGPASLSVRPRED